MKINQVKAGAILSYLQIALNVIVGLLYTPLMIRTLGRAEYGLYNTVASAISMLTMLNLGFGNGYVRFYSRYRSEGRTEEIKRLNGLFLTIFLIIGAVAFSLGLLLTGNLSLVFGDGLTSSELTTARTLMLLLSINLAVSFPMTAFQSIVSAHEKFVFLKLLGMCKTVVGPLVTIPLLLLGYGSVAMVSVTLGVSLFTDVIYASFVLFGLREKFVFRRTEERIFGELFSYTVFIAINIIVDQINWNIDKIIIGRFHGTETVAVYSVGAEMQHYFCLFSTAVSGVFAPRIHRTVNDREMSPTERDGALSSLFSRVGRIQFIVMALIASGFIFFGREFISLWAGAGYDQSYAVALLLVLPLTVPLIQNVGIEIQRAKNKHQFRSIVYLAMALLNLSMTIPLTRHYGAIGAAVGTAISLVVANGIIMNIYYHKALGINVLAFWRGIFKIFPSLILPVIAGLFIRAFIPIGEGVLWLGLGIIIYTAVYSGSLWLFGMNSYEKAIVKKPLLVISQRFFKKKAPTKGENV